jgi:hypothetical protein
MTDQLHLIATPRAQDSPAKGVGRTNLYYARYVNGLHGGGRDGTGLVDLSAWGKLPAPGVDWRESLSRPQDAEVVQRVRSWSCRSGPLGSDRLLRKLERKVGRGLRPRPGAPL